MVLRTDSAIVGTGIPTTMKMTAKTIATSGGETRFFSVAKEKPSLLDWLAVLRSLRMSKRIINRQLTRIESLYLDK